jgi:hypothetical protein
VRAARKQRHQDHQIGQGKQPLVRLRPSRFRGARDEAQMTALGEIVKVIDANPSKSRDLRISEDLLARFNGNHGLGPLDLSAVLPLSTFDAVRIVAAVPM